MANEIRYYKIDRRKGCYAQYRCPGNPMLNGISQWGKDEFEAKLNLQTLLVKLEREQNKTNVVMRMES